jgi:hypothetical protein
MLRYSSVHVLSCPVLSCPVSNNIKSKFHFAVFKTCVDFALVHWVQEATVGSQGGRSGRDKQFVMSWSHDKRQRLLQHSILIKGRVKKKLYEALYKYK